MGVLDLDNKMLDNIVIATVSKTHDEFAQKVAEFAGQNIDITDTIEPAKFSGGSSGQDSG